MKTEYTNQGEKGQSLVEFGVSVVLLLLLLAGAVDIGRLFLTMVSLQEAAQEGAKVASYDPDNLSLITTYVRNSTQGTTNPLNLSGASLTVTPTYSSSNHCTGPGGDWVEIAVTYNFNFTMPLINLVVGPNSQMPVTARSRAMILYPTCP